MPQLQQQLRCVYIYIYTIYATHSLRVCVAVAGSLDWAETFVGRAVAHFNLFVWVSVIFYTPPPPLSLPLLAHTLLIVIALFFCSLLELIVALPFASFTFANASTAAACCFAGIKIHAHLHTHTHRQRRTHRHNPHITTARQKKKEPNCEIPCGLPTQIQIHLSLSPQQHGLRGYIFPSPFCSLPLPASHSFLAAISFQTEICCAQMAHKHFWHLPRREFKNLMPQQINT